MSEHRVSIASPPDRDKVVAMIDFGNEQWAEINVENKELQIELIPRQDGQPWRFRLADVVMAINTAKMRFSEN
jgi:hypothetical protein